MTTDRFAARAGFRPSEGDERLQVLLVVLLALCIGVGWLLIRELEPAARHRGRAPTPIEAAAPGN